MYQFAARPGHAHIYIMRRFREVDPWCLTVTRANMRCDNEGITISVSELFAATQVEGRMHEETVGIRRPLKNGRSSNCAIVEKTKSSSIITDVKKWHMGSTSKRQIEVLGLDIDDSYSASDCVRLGAIYRLEEPSVIQSLVESVVATGCEFVNEVCVPYWFNLCYLKSHVRLLCHQLNLTISWLKIRSTI